MSDVGHSIGKTLTHKVGPLPIAGWFVAIGGGLGLAVILRRSFTTPDAEPEPDSQAFESGVAAGTDPESASGNLFTPAPGSTPPLTPLQPKSNKDWSRVARTELIARGYNPAIAERAIRKFLAGERLSTAERAAVDTALQLVGPPPTSPVPVPVDGGGGGNGSDDPPGHHHPPKGKTPRSAKTNSAWRFRVTELMAREGFGRKRVKNALGDWLHGRKLTPAQQAIIGEVRGRYAPPPDHPDKPKAHDRPRDKPEHHKPDHAKHDKPDRRDKGDHTPGNKPAHHPGQHPRAVAHPHKPKHPDHHAPPVARKGA